MKKPTGKLAFAYASISNLEEQINELKRQNELLEAENDRLNRYYKNGIDCFANPCEEHSGEKTPLFSEFFEKYGGQCLICVVDSNQALQAECEKLRTLLAQACEYVFEPDRDCNCQECVNAMSLLRAIESAITAS